VLAVVDTAGDDVVVVVVGVAPDFRLDDDEDEEEEVLVDDAAVDLRGVAMDDFASLATVSAAIASCK
jgi:hypothetical protein